MVTVRRRLNGLTARANSATSSRSTFLSPDLVSRGRNRLDAAPSRRFRPLLTKSGDRKVLREDVALFARAVNPFNRLRTVTICNGMYAGGTFGAVRALTDARFRDRNTRYAKDRFGQCETFCILTRVHIERGAPLTPDWTLEE